jgi:hypothetical protein
VILAVAAAVMLLVAGGGLIVVAQGLDKPPTSTTVPVAAPPTTAPGPPGTTAPPSQPGAMADRIRRIEDRVEEVRELEFKREVPSEILPTSQLVAKLLAEVDKETDVGELRSQTRALVSLGQIPTGTDLVSLLRGVQAESVLGFYVPGTGPDEGKLFVRSEGGLTPFAEWVLSHELTHALTDQHFDLTRADRLEDQGADDELLAYTALVEGDATLTMQQYLITQMDPASRAAVAREGLNQSTPRLDKAPAVIRESLGFPYDAGLEFVTTLYRRGGWDAVNRAYRDPPTSTEQVLHPDRYLNRDRPTAVTVPDLARRLGTGWKQGTDVGWGEFDTSLLLGDEVPVTAARGAAAGWDGGRLRTFERGNGTAMVLRTVWDSAGEATEYCRVTGRWATARLGSGRGAGSGVTRWSGEGQHAALVCKGARAAWLTAPDPTSLARLQAGLGGP